MMSNIPVNNAGKGRSTAFAVGLALAVTSYAASTAADDTEVFFGQVDSTANIAPNVMFILDTSGSMDRIDEGQEGTRLARMKTAMRDILDNTANVNIGVMSLNGTGGGGPVLYPITPIDAPSCVGAECSQVSLRSTIIDVDNDTEQRAVSGAMIPGGNNLSVGGAEGPNGANQLVGLRFEDLGIPQGATIVSAALEMEAVYNDSGAATITIHGHDTGDADPFTNGQFNLSSRAKTAASTSFDPGAWSANENYESTDISPVIQEIVNRDDWCGGNSLALVLDGTDSRSLKSLENINRSSGKPASLRLTYDASQIPTGKGCLTQTVVSQISTDADDAEQLLNNGVMILSHNYLQAPSSHANQRVATRFREIEVPQGADIVEASIEFTVARGGGSGTPRVDLFGEDVGNSDTFVGRAWELSTRAETAARQTWVISANPAVGTLMVTPDISNVVQEIVSRPDWEAGNNMTLMMDRDNNSVGWRQFGSYRFQPTRAAKLRIKHRLLVGGQGDSQSQVTLTTRNEVLNIVDQFDHVGGTPLVSAHYEAALYLLGREVDYGAQRGANRQRQYRVSHPNSYTGGSLFTPDGCSPSNPGHADCSQERILAGTSPATYISPIADSCQTSHVVILSDGQASTASVAGKVRNLIDQTTCESNSNQEACGTDLAKWLFDTDHNPDIAQTQNIVTHTVGFNIDNADYLKAVAKAGGGGFHPASSAQDLVNAFNSIIDGVQSIDTGFTAPGATVNQFNRLAHREDVYFALFKPTDRPTWNGNLKRYRLGMETVDPDAANAGSDGTQILDVNGDLAVGEDTGFFTETAKSFWGSLDDDGNVTASPDGKSVPEGGAASRIANTGVENRKLFTYTGNTEAIGSGGVKLTTDANRLHEDNTSITDSLLGIQFLFPDAQAQANYRSDLIKWVRGMDIKDVDDDDDTTESRRHMGDPMHSQPQIVNYREGESAADRSVVYVATNEGLLHAIDSETGNELWAYSPADLLENHNLFYENSASTRHPYGLDGTITVWREDPNENFVVESKLDETAFLYVGMRRGGRNYYAFDITDPDDPKLAWVIKGGTGGTPGFEELGESWSEATHTRMRIDSTVRDVLVFGAGYDANQDPDSNRDANGNSLTMTQTADSQGRGLFVVDAITGELLWSVTGPLKGANDISFPNQRFTEMKYSMPADVRVIDIDFDGLADQLYASDMGGQVWRFDVIGNASSGSDLLQGGVIASLADSDKEDQRRFYSEPDVALIQQDGERYLAVTIGSGWRAHPLNDIVDDRMYMIKVRDIRNAPAGYGRQNASGTWVPITENNLARANADSATDTEDYTHGWYLDFPDAGEKVLGTSLIFKNVLYFTTYVPAHDVAACETALGTGFAYALSIGNGKPVLDFDNDGSINTVHSSGNKSTSEDARSELNHKGLPPNVAVLIGQDSNGNAADPQLFIGTERVNAAIVSGTTRTFWVDSGIED